MGLTAQFFFLRPAVADRWNILINPTRVEVWVFRIRVSVFDPRDVKILG